MLTNYFSCYKLDNTSIPLPRRIISPKLKKKLSPLSSPLADWAAISDPRALDLYWIQLLLAASDQIAANNLSRKHHVYAHWAQPFYIYPNTKLLKAPIGQKWCHLCRLGLWKPLDGDKRELLNPAQFAKGEERGDRERNPCIG